MCELCKKLEAQLAKLRQERDEYKALAERRFQVMQGMDAIMKADIVVSTYACERNEVYEEILRRYGLLPEDGDV